jgi:hypothetical protein
MTLNKSLKFPIILLILIIIVVSSSAKADPPIGTDDGSGTNNEGDQKTQAEKDAEFLGEHGIPNIDNSRREGSSIVFSGSNDAATVTNAKTSEEQAKQCKLEHPDCPPCVDKCMNLDSAEQVNDPWVEWLKVRDYATGKTTYASAAESLTANSPWKLVLKRIRDAMVGDNRISAAEADEIMSSIPSESMGMIGDGFWSSLVDNTANEATIEVGGATGVVATTGNVHADTADEVNIGGATFEDASNFDFDGTTATADYADLTLNTPNTNPTTIQEASNLKITGATVTAQRIGQVNLGGNLPLIAKDIENVTITTAKDGTKNISFDTTSTTPVLIQNTMNVTRVDIIAIDGNTKTYK